MIKCVCLEDTDKELINDFINFTQILINSLPPDGIYYCDEDYIANDYELDKQLLILNRLLETPFLEIKKE